MDNVRLITAHHVVKFVISDSVTCYEKKHLLPRYF